MLVDSIQTNVSHVTAIYDIIPHCPIGSFWVNPHKPTQDHGAVSGMHHLRSERMQNFACKLCLRRECMHGHSVYAAFKGSRTLCMCSCGLESPRRRERAASSHGEQCWTKLPDPSQVFFSPPPPFCASSENPHHYMHSTCPLPSRELTP
jgi:hypothetical protein